MVVGLRQAYLFFAAFLLLQAAFWWYSLDHKPRMEIVPNVPSATAVKAISFGDSQFFFRVLGLMLQNFGDSWGRYTPLKDYDYPKLGRWFALLDTLDNQSNYIPTMAGAYYSQSQNPEDTIYVIRYLQHHAKGRINEKWWWQAQAVYIANHKLKDKKLALELALPLVNAKNVPLWVNQLAAFLYEQQGEFDSAAQIIDQIKNHVQNIPPAELRFMEYFVKERLAAFKQIEKQSSTGATR
jgi:hypothetical protein